MSTVIKASGFPSFPEATLRVWGMAQQDMNALAVVQTDTGKPQYTRNTVQIEADSGSGYTYVFSGQIMVAGPDYSDSPDVCLYVQAQALGFELLTAANPTAYPGVANVSDVIEAIASKMGMAFENDGVTGTFTNPYYVGALPDQLRQAAQDANIYCAIEQGLVVISPAGVPRSIEPFVLTPQSGLIGYPQALGNGNLSVRSFFNPAYRFNGPLTIKNSQVIIDAQLTSINTKADGNWSIGPMTHTLESNKPGGAWFTEMTVYNPSTAPPLA